MGRNAGYIAIDCGIAVGATGIAIPELPFDKDTLINKIHTLSLKGKRNFIVMVSEGMGAEFSEGLAKVQQNGKWCIINKEGTVIVSDCSRWETTWSKVYVE
jgi:6-phosphofructokinase 1